ncbi:hypothetical protein BY458DRAFT_561211 [Sporodiniella umbellata]|nr:hypothetical protein BY458DRAFT_561211 [Sporodiniella umbellata]
MHYIAICFGKLGAVDPTTVDLEIYSDKTQIKDDFKSISENQRFICQVLLDCILPAFKAAKGKQVQFVSFSLQALLKSAGFTTVETMKQKRYEYVYKLWLQFPSSVQEILAPFLRTSYKISQVDISAEYPIYLHSTDFSSWVRLWYCTLEKRTNGAAKTIFGACLPVIFNGNTKVATYLLPYLVHHVLLSSTLNETQKIVEEILNVLQTESIDTRALEVVVSITAHCRQSLNQETRANKMAKFLNCIPDKLMAQASFGVKAYPQTLMHLESYIRANPTSMTDEDILPLLGKTYAKLELKADLEVLLSTHSAHFLRTAKLIFVESLGRWDEARVHYADRIQRHPDDLEACINYLGCLKKAGNYESILYHADLFGRRHSSWLSYMNSFKMDSAWHLNDYTLMKRFSQEPSMNTYENRIACILLAMHEDRGIETLSHLESAREELVSQLGAQSYRQLYPIIFKLQVLQEMDDALTLQDEDEIEKLAISWTNSVKRVVPQSEYVLELLRVRYAILYNRLPMRCSSDIWLDIAKISRKSGDLSMSLDAIMNAERESGKYYHQERAKWSWAKGMRKEALNLLGVNKGENGNIDDIVLLCSFYLKDRSVLPRSFMDKLMRKGLECKSRPEKAYEQFCRHANLHMEETISNTSRGLKALTFGTKYYYATMSRIINCWFKAYHFSQEMVSTKLESFSREVLDNINRHIRNQATTLPPYMYGKFFTRLISHLTIGHKGVVETLAYIIEYVFTAYPQQTIWLLLGPLKSKTVALHEQVKGILQSARNKSRDGLIPEIIKQGLELQKHLDKLSKQQFTSRSSNTLDLRSILNFDKLLEMKNLLLTIPGENSLFPRLPDKAHDLNFQPFPGKPVTIKEILPEITVMKSLQQPKKISIVGSDGKIYQFLCKANDDLRKDARMMEFNYMINSFLKKSPISRSSNLFVPLGDDWGLIEWIQNIVPLKVIVAEKLKSKGIDLQQVQQSYRVQRTNTVKATTTELTNMFKNVCESCPVVLQEWFSDIFPEPTQWLESRTRYTKTLAVMSMVGHILGLGDRHAENILFDCTNGDTVHVDLNMLFDRGKLLSVPEVVPYRLTRNLVAAMGVSGYEGLFLKACQETLQVLNDNKDALVSVFQTLYNEWGTESKSREAMVKMEERFREATRPNHAKSLAKDAVNPESLAGMFPANASLGWAAFL